MKKRVVILSDLCTWTGTGMTRYIGPYRIASQLEYMGYDTRVIDWFTCLSNPLRFIKEFLNSETVAVCVSTTFLTPPVREGKDRGAIMSEYRKSELWHESPEDCVEWFAMLRQYMKEKCPDAKIILGGSRVSQLYARTEESLKMTYPFIDIAVLGAADLTISTVIDDVVRGRKPYGKDKGGITFVTPAFESKHTMPTKWQGKWGIQLCESLPVEISRGCVYNCKFCHYDKKFSNVRSAESLRDEIVRNFDTFGTTKYHFCDDCFNDRLDKVETVCKTLIDTDIPLEWISYARADLSIKYPHTIPLMQEAGARGFFFGIETFNYQAGRAAGKGVPPDKVKEFLLGLRKNTNLLVEASFITGLPHETVETQRATFDWIEQNDPFDFYTTAALGLYEYHPDLDQTVMDYADYSKNPQKYGFSEIKTLPDNSVYWKHEGMDLFEARTLNQEGVSRWAKNHPKQDLKSFWWYPSYRSLGVSHEEIRALARGEHLFYEEHYVRTRWRNRFQNYQRDMMRCLSDD